MKLAVSTIAPDAGRTDHLLDLPESATVAELGSALGAERLYLGERLVSPELRVGSAGIRAGAVLGLGAPVPVRTATRAWQPPPRDPVLVEVRHVGGPGAGRTWLLGPGSHEVGTDRGCALRLE
ncbi:hypothetical protein, partial [Streptomyces sp. DfronAA-171]